MAAGLKSNFVRFLAMAVDFLSLIVAGVVDLLPNVVVDVVKPFLAICVRGRPAPCQRPVSVNYHFLRTCNYSCGFCFHTAKTSYVLPIDEVQRHHF